MTTHDVPKGYTTLEERKNIGAHYTPTLLSDFVATQIVACLLIRSKDSVIKVLDPAVGDGELLISIIKVLTDNGFKKLQIFGYDTDPFAIQYAKDRIEKYFPNIQVKLKNEDFLQVALSYNYLDLFNQPENQYDVVIANPPYVRTQVMGAKESKTLSRQFNLSGRVDLYHAFIIAISKVMCPGGIVGIIVSNRFMTTKGGESVRNGINKEFNVIHVWDFGDTQLFEAAVLPAVLLLEREKGQNHNRSPKFTSIYRTESDQVNSQCQNCIDAVEYEGVIRTSDGSIFVVKHGELAIDQTADGLWRLSNESSEGWLDKVEKHTYCTFGDIGKIRVGVKTTADKIFIRTDWNDIPENERPEVLRPLITHHIARKFRALEIDRDYKILYTHLDQNGRRVVINLQDYPKTAKYLHRYRSVLEKRDYLISSGRNWYEIWVPQEPTLWAKPKIVFRDISSTPTFWMDLSGAIVNGDCYWFISDQPGNDDLLWLALAVANSSFIESFYDFRFNNKLYSGRRRFMTQYVEKFPVPDPNLSSSQKIIEITKQIYDLIPTQMTSMFEVELDSLIWKAFSLSVEKSFR
jgi:SAM-dependent methyltransferase